MAALTPSPPASATPLHFQGAAQLARRIAAGDISSRALLEAMLARVAKYNPALNAIILLRADEAGQRAWIPGSSRRTVNHRTMAASGCSTASATKIRPEPSVSIKWPT